MSYDFKLRDTIIFGNYDKARYTFGICRFKISSDIFEQLLKNNFINLKNKHNDSPTIEAFYEFVKKYPNYYYHGFATARKNDYNINIEGIGKNSIIDSIEEMKDFVKLCRKADDFIIDETVYAWWD